VTVENEQCELLWQLCCVAQLVFEMV